MLTSVSGSTFVKLTSPPVTTLSDLRFEARQQVEIGTDSKTIQEGGGGGDRDEDNEDQQQTDLASSGAFRLSRTKAIY
jgi:hypothetical protein